MSMLVDQLLRSPRARVYLDEMTERMSREETARRQFRETMNEDTRAEFINGEVYVHSPARYIHNRTAERVYRLLDAATSRRGLGVVGHEKYLVALTRNDVEPDVCYWSREKSDAFTADQMLFPAPDLVVEVLSNSTAALDRGVKFDDYAAHGVREYWIVDADARVIEQHVLCGDAYELRLKSSDGTLACQAIPGLNFNVMAIFDDTENHRAVDAFR